MGVFRCPLSAAKNTRDVRRGEFNYRNWKLIYFGSPSECQAYVCCWIKDSVRVPRNFPFSKHKENQFLFRISPQNYAFAQFSWHVREKRSATLSSTLSVVAVPKIVSWERIFHWLVSKWSRRAGEQYYGACTRFQEKIFCVCQQKRLSVRELFNKLSQRWESERFSVVSHECGAMLCINITNYPLLHMLRTSDGALKIDGKQNSIREGNLHTSTETCHKLTPAAHIPVTSIALFGFFPMKFEFFQNN